MQALHSIEEIESKNSGFATRIQELQDYLANIKENKGMLSFEAHEQAISRYVYAIGQAAMSEVLSHYDVEAEVVGIGEQTYRRSHRAVKEYQTAFGGVKVARNMILHSEITRIPHSSPKLRR